MKLKKPCEHDLYDPHIMPAGLYGFGPSSCPGGEFLSGDSLVLVYEDLDPELVMDLVLDFLDRD